MTAAPGGVLISVSFYSFQETHKGKKCPPNTSNVHHIPIYPASTHYGKNSIRYVMKIARFKTMCSLSTCSEHSADVSGAVDVSPSWFSFTAWDYRLLHFAPLKCKKNKKTTLDFILLHTLENQQIPVSQILMENVSVCQSSQSSSTSSTNDCTPPPPTQPCWPTPRRFDRPIRSTALWVF